MFSSKSHHSFLSPPMICFRARAIIFFVATYDTFSSKCHHFVTTYVTFFEQEYFCKLASTRRRRSCAGCHGEVTSYVRPTGDCVPVEEYRYLRAAIAEESAKKKARILHGICLHRGTQGHQSVSGKSKSYDEGRGGSAPAKSCELDGEERVT